MQCRQSLFAGHIGTPCANTARGARWQAPTHTAWSYMGQEGLYRILGVLDRGPTTREAGPASCVHCVRPERACLPVQPCLRALMHRGGVSPILNRVLLLPCWSTPGASRPQGYAQSMQGDAEKGTYL